MQGRRAAGKKRSLVAAPQSLQPRAGASQPRDAGPHASERGAHCTSGLRTNRCVRPSGLKKATGSPGPRVGGTNPICGRGCGADL